MPTTIEDMKTEIERATEGRVVTAPPVVTGKGWRATVRGGWIGLLSYTDTSQGSSEGMALAGLGSLLVEERARRGLTD